MISDAWKKLLRDVGPKAKAYWTKALEHLEKTGTEWVVIEARSDQFREWVRYFRFLGFKPRMLGMIEERRLDNIAVPAEWPQWFDPAYNAEIEPPPFPTVDYPFAPPVHANLFVPSNAVSYPRVLQFTKDAPQKFWRADRDGVWVPRIWFESGRTFNDWHSRLDVYNPGLGKWDGKEIRAAKKRSYTDEEKAAFLESAKITAKEIEGMKLSDEARRRQP